MELVRDFLQGSYLKTLLSKPMLLNEGGQPKLGSDGLRVLLNGLSTILALLICRKIYREEEEWTEFEPDWTPALAKALTEGVQDLPKMQFADADADVYYAYNVQIHDVDSNKYKPSSMLNLVEVARRFQKKAPGGTWDATQQALLKFYGPHKKMLVWRMVTAAQILPQKILVTASKLKIDNSYIHENKYFLGRNAEKNMRLSEDKSPGFTISFNRISHNFGQNLNIFKNGIDN